MTELEVERRCIEMIAKTKGLPAESVTLEKTFEDLGIDSLDKINISFEVEEAFGIEIPDEALVTLRTVGDVVEGVQRLRAVSAAKVG